MALRDSFGFHALPTRAGWEEVSQEPRRSHHERTDSSSSSPSSSNSSSWTRVRLPSFGGEADTAALERASKQTAKLKILARCQPPSDQQQRRALWFFASGGALKQQGAAKAQPALSYTRLAKSAAKLPSSVIVQVDTDVRGVGLTWRQHPLFHTAPCISALSNIVVALLTANPRLSYSRQLTHIVAFTLVVFGGPEREEEVFWTVLALLEEKLFGYCQGQFSLGVRVEQEVLSRLVARKLPRLTAHLATLRMSIATFTQPWLSGLFVSHLPPETLARVWDAMVMEGPKVLLRTGLALLKMYEQTLSSCSFPEVMRKVLDLRVSRTMDAPALMAAAFKGCGSLPGSQVDALRQDALRLLRDFSMTPDRGSPSGGTPARATSPVNIVNRISTVAARKTGGATVTTEPAAVSYGSAGSVAVTQSVVVRGDGAARLGSSSPAGSSSTGDLMAVTDSRAAVTDSREASPGSSGVQLARSRSGKSLVGVQLTSMLSRLVGGVKAVTSPSTTGAGGMRRVATTANAPALAAC